MIRSYFIEHLDWRMLLDVGYHVFLYGLIFVAIWMIGKRYFLYFASQTMEVVRMRSIHDTTLTAKPMKDHALNRHLSMLLKSTQSNYKETSIQYFYYVSFAVLAIAFFVFFRLTGNIKQTLFISIIASLLPYLYLRTKLQRNRAIASQDLLPAMNLLLAKYRSQNYSMYFALLDLVKELQGPIKQAFYGIILDIQQRKDTDLAVRVFHYQINSSWSFQLALMILQAIKEGKQVENGIDRLVREMTDTSVYIEKENSENRDMLQLGYFPIFGIPLTMLLNQKISGGRSFHFYFDTSEGLSMLIFTIIVCTISFLVAMMSSKVKNDI